MKYKPGMGWLIQTEINKKAREMTKKCEEHKCPYLKRLAGAHDKINSLYYCAYLEISGNARIKEPENIDQQKCNHWQDKNVKIKDPSNLLF